MDFDATNIVTSITLVGIVWIFGSQYRQNSRISVLEDKSINTEQMRTIMKDVMAPLMEDVHQLRAEVGRLRSEISKRRAGD